MSLFEFPIKHFSVISDSFRIFSLWPLIVSIFQTLIHSEAFLSVRLLTNLELLYKHNNDREPDVSFLNTCVYTFNTFG